jgi:hypothetical protein
MPTYRMISTKSQGFYLEKQFSHSAISTLFFLIPLELHLPVAKAGAASRLTQIVFRCIAQLMSQFILCVSY